MAKNRVEAAKRLVELVEQHPWGITSTELRAATGMSSRRIHKLLRASGKVVEKHASLLPCGGNWRCATTWRPRTRDDDISDAWRKFDLAEYRATEEGRPLWVN